MEFISNKVIRIDKELSDLDLFMLDFIRILRKYTNYVIVSGYVSILLGRARSSEDIDIIIQKMEYPNFVSLLKEIRKHGFYCLNAEKNKSIYDYIVSHFAVRFAKLNIVIPNIELKFSKNKIDEISLNDNIIINLNQEKIIISNLEIQIAFKESILRSPKDIEDARHIRNIAKRHLNNNLIKDYKLMLDEIYRRKSKGKI